MSSLKLLTILTIASNEGNVSFWKDEILKTTSSIPDVRQNKIFAQNKRQF